MLSLTLWKVSAACLIFFSGSLAMFFLAVWTADVAVWPTFWAVFFAAAAAA